MRVSISARASAYVADTDEEMTDPVVLAALDGIATPVEPLAAYLSWELAELGIVDGSVRVVFSEADGLWVSVDYGAPEVLPPHAVKRLTRETLRQWDDGIGESGLRLLAGGSRLDVFVNSDASNVSVVQVDDGVDVHPAAPVALCARRGDVAAMAEAISGGEDLDGRLQGYPALQLAILGGHVDAALALIERGADVTTVSDDGTCAIHQCALARKLSDADSAQIASALLARGADPEARTTRGETATELAVFRGKRLLALMLQSPGSTTGP